MSKLISVRIAAKELGLAAATLYAMVKQRAIPVHRFGDRILIDLEEVKQATRVAAESETLPVNGRGRS